MFKFIFYIKLNFLFLFNLIIYILFFLNKYYDVYICK